MDTSVLGLIGHIARLKRAEYEAAIREGGFDV